MESRFPPALRAAGLLLLCLAACSDGSSGGGGGGGPDTSDLERSMAGALAAQVGDAGRVVSFRITGSKAEEGSGGSVVEVQFEMEVEFSGPAYYRNREWKKGERLRESLSASYAKSSKGWQRIPGVTVR